MQLPNLNPETAFAMTALSSWSLVGLLWVTARSFPRQGVAWVMASLGSAGLGYMWVALSNAWPTEPTLQISYLFLGLGSALASVGIRRFLRQPWSGADTALLLLPLILPLVWLAIAGSDFAERARLSNAGFVLQNTLLATIVFRGRKAMVGHGWKALLLGTGLQCLSIVPFALPGSPPSTAEATVHTLSAQLVAWLLCAVMFFNLQLSVLSFLLLLQDRRAHGERQAAELDVLTQLPNRRALARQLAALWPLLCRQQASIGVILLDIDHFKQVNDQFGHNEGDRVLQHISRILAKEVRQGEMLARYGGEEFVIVLPYADVAAARTVSSRVLDKVRSTPLAVAGAPHRVTISAGVYVHKVDTSAPHSALDSLWQLWVRQADGALYAAKHAGRDQFMVSDKSVGSVHTA